MGGYITSDSASSDEMFGSGQQPWKQSCVILFPAAAALTEKIGFCVSLAAGLQMARRLSAPPGYGVPDLGAPENTPATLRLGKVLDLAAAAALKEELAQLRGHPAVIDASNVQRLGTQCAQVLLSARRTWLAESQIFEIKDASEAFSEGLNRLGVHEMLQAMEIAA
jgi:chemotaxis protein CheX